jgi:hypothetical protein
MPRRLLRSLPSAVIALALALSLAVSPALAGGGSTDNGQDPPLAPEDPAAQSSPTADTLDGFSMLLIQLAAALV